MTKFYDIKTLIEQKIHSVSDGISNHLSRFFYRFAKSNTTTLLKKYRGILASSYDTFAIIAAWITASWILISITSETDGLDNASYSLFFISLYWKTSLVDLLYIIPSQLLLFRWFGLYRGLWRFASLQDLRKILAVSFMGGLLARILLWANAASILSPALNPFSKPQISVLLPNSTALLYSLCLIALLSSSRLVVRFLRNFTQHYRNFRRVIIVGAGYAGEGLARDLLRSGNHLYRPVAFVDDDKTKQGREIHGIRVVGTLADLPESIKKYDADIALIAIPSASSANMRYVVDSCEKAAIPYYTLPGIHDLTNGRISINNLRSISLEDLLGRNPITCQWKSIEENIENKTILITGGGGSIGSELCRQIAGMRKNTRLIIIDSNEYNLYAIDIELRQRFPTYAFHPILLSVTDRIGIKSVLKEFSPHIVFHGSAYKHVPLLEDHPRVAIFNNIIGTQIIAEEAVEAGVEKFILISTDKAVNPTSVMGATKRAAEYFCQNLNYQTFKTRFITVRFGNVLDSAGSVIPLFRKQIDAGGPVTVTHPDMTRFFMTIPEATQLILQSAFLGQGGEIFVLDMGEPIKIQYLAEQMIKLSGKTIGQDINITYTGLRSGEKLYEECFYPDEVLQPTTHAKILRAQSQWRDMSAIQELCHLLATACLTSDIDNSALLHMLKNLVPEYQPPLNQSQVS